MRVGVGEKTKEEEEEDEREIVGQRSRNRFSHRCGSGVLSSSSSQRRTS